MTLADRQTKPDTRTDFEKWLDGLSEKNKTTVTGWLMDKSISQQKVADWIREDDADDAFTGYPATKSTIQVWRGKHAG